MSPPLPLLVSTDYFSFSCFSASLVACPSRCSHVLDSGLEQRAEPVPPQFRRRSQRKTSSLPVCLGRWPTLLWRLTPLSQTMLAHPRIDLMAHRAHAARPKMSNVRQAPIGKHRSLDGRNSLREGRRPTKGKPRSTRFRTRSRFRETKLAQDTYRRRIRPFRFGNNPQYL